MAALAVVGLVVALGVFIGVGNVLRSGTSSSGAAPAATTQATATATAAAEIGPTTYAQITIGMTREQVAALLGGPGRTKDEGVNGTSGPTTAVVEWQDPVTLDAIIVAFVNDRATSKNAVGF